MNKEKRTALHYNLLKITNHVYYQPTDNTKLLYPCIVYDEIDETVFYANGGRFVTIPKVQVTVIDKVPDSDLTESFVAWFPYARFTNKFVSDNLYHTLYELNI